MNDVLGNYSCARVNASAGSSILSTITGGARLELVAEFQVEHCRTLGIRIRGLMAT